MQPTFQILGSDSAESVAFAGAIGTALALAWANVQMPSGNRTTYNTIGTSFAACAGAFFRAPAKCGTSHLSQNDKAT